MFSDIDEGSFELEDSIVYFGNYFIELEAGDLLVFVSNDDSLKGYLAASASVNVQAPYDCGLYRVGTDIPAGTYTITVSEPAADVASMECAAYTMKDIEWNDDSITNEAYVVLGGSQTVTVQNGDWLELYATIATPVN